MFVLSTIEDENLPHLVEDVVSGTDDWPSQPSGHPLAHSTPVELSPEPYECLKEENSSDYDMSDDVELIEEENKFETIAHMDKRYL